MEAAAILEQDIVEGCREMADVYLEIQREFQPLDKEAACAYDSMQEVNPALEAAVGLR